MPKKKYTKAALAVLRQYILRGAKKKSPKSLLAKARKDRAWRHEIECIYSRNTFYTPHRSLLHAEDMEFIIKTAVEARQLEAQLGYPCDLEALVLHFAEQIEEYGAFRKLDKAHGVSALRATLRGLLEYEFSLYHEAEDILDALAAQWKEQAKEYRKQAEERAKNRSKGKTIKG